MDTDERDPALSPRGHVADLDRQISHLLVRGDPDAAALILQDESISYATLAARVAERAEELGQVRRLVFLEASNDVESVVTYLAAIQARHPVLLAAPGDATRHRELLERYRPDVVQTQEDGKPHELHRGSRHDLHPELAVLLSTSGSTGSPRLVRLSRQNLAENAASIAEYLELRPTDRGITTLPLHYCYGLSILNSHLSIGAGVVLSELSVADECFWTLAAEGGVTGLAGVPYTFDLLEASGFRNRKLPSLRYLTQAGGRMEPSRVRDYAELGQRRGWDLFVMYGQTEATARMAYLPPCLAASCPDSIGIPIPGGCFRLRKIDFGDDRESDVGELVYEGPNVMMGYAEHPGQLADGATLEELRTGDLARQGPDGLWQIVGRINRIAKVFGLRLDLERIETALAGQGKPVRLAARPDQLWAFTQRPRQTETIRHELSELTTLPPSALRVVYLDRLPLTPSGKPDAVALDAHIDDILAQDAGSTVEAASTASPDTIRDLYAVILGRPDATTADSFVDLGGDSLSYVEASSALGDLLGTLPASWPQLAPDSLAAHAVRPTRRRRGHPAPGLGVPVEISVALRATAVTFIIVSHADIAQLQGGAHVLLAVMGYNLARFQLRRRGRWARVAAVGRAAVAVALPAALWILGVILIAGGYRWSTALFLNGALGSDTWNDDWQFWFLEALVWTYVGLAALLAVPWIDRWQRVSPFAAAMAALGGCLVLRYAWIGVEAVPIERFTMVSVLWFAAAGGAFALARAPWQRALVAAVTVFATVGFFGDPRRETIVIIGILALSLDRPVRLPRFVASAVQTIAVASLWIYLTQWHVYPGLEDAGHPYLAVLASLLVGILAHRLYGWLGRTGRGFLPFGQKTAPSDAAGSRQHRGRRGETV